jgi:hypothetical protein
VNTQNSRILACFSSYTVGNSPRRRPLSLLLTLGARPGVKPGVRLAAAITPPIRLLPVSPIMSAPDGA